MSMQKLQLNSSDIGRCARTSEINYPKKKKYRLSILDLTVALILKTC